MSDDSCAHFLTVTLLLMAVLLPQGKQSVHITLECEYVFQICLLGEQAVTDTPRNISPTKLQYKESK